MKVMILPVTLTQEEILARGRELAGMKEDHTEAQRGLESAAENWKLEKKSFEAQIEDIEAEMRRVARAIRTGHEERTVEIEDVPDFAANVMRTRRLDTGELVKTRGLDENERQRALFSEAGEAAAEG